MKFSVIIADPPVPFEAWGKRPGGTDSRSAEAHYSTMTWADLNNLGALVKGVAADDCVLFMWLCQPLLIETLDMIRAWGFEYKTKAFSWVKVYPNSHGLYVGMGYWTRANTEDVLLCTRGNPHRNRKDVAQVLATLESAPCEVPAIVAANTKHSRKPEAVQDKIERLIGGPYIELFARRQRPGWTCLGNEIDGLDIRDALRRAAESPDAPMPTIQHIEQPVLF